MTSECKFVWSEIIYVCRQREKMEPSIAEYKHLCLMETFKSLLRYCVWYVRKWYQILILKLENVYSLNFGSRNRNLMTCTFPDYLDRIVCTHTQSRVTYISQRTPVDSRWFPKCRKIDVILPLLYIFSCFIYAQDDTFLYNRNWRP